MRVRARGEAAEVEADRAADAVLRGGAVRVAVRPQGDTESGSGGDGGEAVEALAASQGAPLDPELRRAMEARFGVGFADVRIHADGAAERAAGALGARAFTLGHRVGFAAGAWRPQAPAGLHLLAHELAHVAQGVPDTVALSPEGLSDAEVLALAEATPVRVEALFMPQFQHVKIAGKNGFIHVNDVREFERQLRWKARQGDREWESTWTLADETDLNIATDEGNRAQVLEAKWNLFVHRKYIEYLTEKSLLMAEYDRRVGSAFGLVQIIGGVTVGAAALFTGGTILAGGGTGTVGGGTVAATGGGTAATGGGFTTAAQLAAGKATTAYITKPLVAIGGSVLYGVATPPGAPDLPGPFDEAGRQARTVLTSGRIGRGADDVARGAARGGDDAARAVGGAARAVADPPPGAAGQMADVFVRHFRNPAGRAATIELHGVGFGGIEMGLKGGELTIVYSHIIRRAAAPAGSGASMHRAFEQGAVEAARRLGAKTVRVGVSSIQNEYWRAHLKGQGYGLDEFVNVFRGDTTYTNIMARIFSI